jgi:hypothetical protein
MKKCGRRTSHFSSSRGASRPFRASRPSRPAYTYQVNLTGGRKYIGMAQTKQSLKKRIRDQLSQAENASSVCRNAQPVSVTKVWRHPSVQAAKKAETSRYHSSTAILGKDKVRGAGHTKAF